MTFTIGTSSVRMTLLATLAGLSLLNGCVTEEEGADELEADTLGASSNFVASWASTAADAIVRPNEASTALRSPGPSSMLMAQVQLAVYDTMASIAGDWKAFSYTGGSGSDPDAKAAVATAAYRILRTRVPGRAAYLDSQYATALGAIKASSRKTKGIALGEAVASHYLALRANDNIDNNYTWVQPAPGPGVFEPVAPAQPVDYKMVFVPPLTFDISETPSFFPPAPPALSSAQYATAWNETRSYGGANSTTRTDAQKQLALWSGENAFRWTSRNLIGLATATRLDPMKSARFFALTFTSVADAFQAGMSAKYNYNVWRPFHSIPRADTDGNDATTADPTWSPLLNVNHPEYPAGHGFVGAGSMVESVRAFFGTDAVSWTVNTVGVTGLTQTSRSYTSLDALARDVMDARVLAGLHYRFSVEAGRALGKAIVDHVSASFFQPQGIN
jgi:hypothetical protein